MIAHYKTARRHPELERLICAAVSNQGFAKQLISAPAVALERSTYGCRLTPTEWELVTSVSGATDIYDFAARLHACIQRAER